MHYFLPQILVAIVVLVTGLSAVAQPTKIAPYPGDFAPHPVIHPNPNDSPKAELDWWFNYLRNKIFKCWDKDLRKLPPSRCSCTFTLEDAGKMSNLTLVTSSGSAEIDQSFLEAVRKASPLVEQKLALHRTIEVDFASMQNFQLHCKLLPEIPEKSSKP
jgi:TonB family protein